MKKKFKKIKWKKLLSAALALLLVAGVIAGVATLAGKKTKTISSFAFERGTIDANGVFAKSDTSIYTKDMFECQGLTIAPDFQAAGTYQVFYYAADKSFVGSTPIMNANDGTYVRGDDFALAKYAYIVINPDSSTFAEEGEDFKIRFYEVTGYANDYTITVNKKQKWTWSENVYSLDSANKGKYYKYSLDHFEEMGSYVPSMVIDLDGCTEVAVLVNDYSSQYAVPQLCFADASGTFIESINLFVEVGMVSGNVGYFEVEIPEGAVSAVLNGLVISTYCIFIR